MFIYSYIYFNQHLYLFYNRKKKKESNISKKKRNEF